MVQKSNCLFKTWLTKMSVSCNNGEEVLLVLVYMLKEKTSPQFQIFYEYFLAILTE